MTTKNGVRLLVSIAVLSAVYPQNILQSVGQIVNTGTMSGRILIFDSRNMQADGGFVGKEEIRLTCSESFAGTGYLNAPVIMIKTAKFAFTGTITCDTECTIIAKGPFNERMFTRKGTGKFKVMIDPNLEL